MQENYVKIHLIFYKKIKLNLIELKQINPMTKETFIRLLKTIKLSPV